MPDRAVVAQKHRDHCQRMLNQSAGMKGPEWDIARESWQRCLADAEQERLGSRAIVALSDDQNYLCLLLTNEWMVFEIDWEEWNDLRMKALIDWEDRIEDTGQDAHQVLAQWMAGLKR